MFSKVPFPKVRPPWCGTRRGTCGPGRLIPSEACHHVPANRAEGAPPTWGTRIVWPPVSPARAARLREGHQVAIETAGYSPSDGWVVYPLISFWVPCAVPRRHAASNKLLLTMFAMVCAYHFAPRFVGVASLFRYGRNRVQGLSSGRARTRRMRWPALLPQAPARHRCACSRMAHD
jgi:hypothetical protein